MQRVRSGDVHDVHVRVGDQLLVGAVRPRTRVLPPGRAGLAGDQVGELPRGLGTPRRDGGDLGVGEDQQVAREGARDRAGGQDAPAHRAVGGQRLGHRRAAGEVQCGQVCQDGGHRPIVVGVRNTRRRE